MIELITINKKGDAEHFTLACKSILLIGETKQGACIHTDLGEYYDVVNSYKDVIKAYEQATQSVVVVADKGADYVEAKH